LSFDVSKALLPAPVCGGDRQGLNDGDFDRPVGETAVFELEFSVELEHPVANAASLDEVEWPNT
jgi:hypothetical protein